MSLDQEQRSSVVEVVDTTDAIHDAARLAALRDLELLDSGPDEVVDRYTRLATEFLGVPVSLVSLLDSDRQYFLSQQGLAGQWADDRQAPLSHSFCQYAVASKAPVVVEDARLDAVLAGNLAVRDLGIVAYAGVPLVLEDGSAVGALCAFDGRPRRWSERDLRVLEDLAAGLEALLDLRGALARRGLHDRITGLPNRSLLVAYCDELLERTEADRLVAVMCAGLDHFSQINQALGTEEADAVLKTVGERLQQVVRGTDVFGRLRGDVFTLIAPGVRDEAEALMLAARLRGALSASPILIGDEILNVGVTVGIATGGRGDRGPDLISEAANAMREAKQRHDRVWVSDAAWSAEATSQLRLRDALRGALTRGEIHAVFQPIVELEGEKLRGFEALARWHSPALGDVSPAEFVPIAELTADIIPIGEWMLEAAAAQAAKWRAEVDPRLRVTVNVAPLQLEQSNFAEVFAATLERHGLPGEAIGVEITEGGLLETGVIQQRNLSALHELGAPIVLDDFGTGYSALSYLRRFPIDVIKLDRSFVETLGEDRTSAALVQAILTMSRGIDMHVVGEGIETKEQAKLLRLLGCRYGQGYLFGRPAAAAQALPR
jgi:diguanylate cyclase (GGDEF)-like protein